MLAEKGDVRLAFCWAHVRRRFYELAAGPAPIATEMLERIAALYRIETEIRGRPAEARRLARRERTRPVLDALEPFLRQKLQLINQKTKLAEAIRYTLSRWEGLCRFADDGRVEISAQCAALSRQQHRRALHPTPGLTRKNALFAGSDGGTGHWAVIASLIETCKLNGIDPQAYMTAVITLIVQSHPNSGIDDPMPWQFRPADVLAVGA